MGTERGGLIATYRLRVPWTAFALLVFLFVAWSSAQQAVKAWFNLSEFGVYEIAVFLFWMMFFVLNVILAGAAVRLLWMYRETLRIDESGIVDPAFLRPSGARWTWDEIESVELVNNMMERSLRLHLSPRTAMSGGSDRLWFLRGGRLRREKAGVIHEIGLELVAAPPEEVFKAVQDGLEAARLRRRDATASRGSAP